MLLNKNNLKKNIQEVIDVATKWMEYAGIEGIGQGEKDGADCIVVFISIPLSKLEFEIPSSINGYQIIIEESGSISAQ